MLNRNFAELSCKGNNPLGTVETIFRSSIMTCAWNQALMLNSPRPTIYFPRLHPLTIPFLCTRRWMPSSSLCADTPITAWSRWWFSSKNDSDLVLNYFSLASVHAKGELFCISTTPSFVRISFHLFFFFRTVLRSQHFGFDAGSGRGLLGAGEPLSGRFQQKGEIYFCNGFSMKLDFCPHKSFHINFHVMMSWEVA